MASPIFNGLITLSESAKMLWDLLKNDASIDDLVNKLLSEYEIDEETAKNDTLEFVQSLKDNIKCNKQRHVQKRTPSYLKCQITCLRTC